MSATPALSSTQLLNALGVLQQQGKPMDLYARPANAFVAGFIGSPAINFVDAKHVSADAQGVIAVRPEHIAVSSQSGLWPGQITLVERLGADTIIYVHAAPGDLTVRLQGEASLGFGDSVFLTPDAARIHSFPERP